jgi:insulysin
MTIKPIYLPPVEQGKSDYRNYRPLTLGKDEGITILLVNDPQSKHFAAAVSVGSGASSDPRILPGLAHFCEHMCFLGSSAYPKENEYKQYLSQHGGKSNASTSMSHTTYQFDVLADYAEKALDIFSHFFISPLFTKSGTGREVHAVDSENSKNLVNDGRRRWQILKSLGDPNHHFSKFSTGNKDTLPAGADMHNGEATNNDTKSSLDSKPSTTSSEEIPMTTHPLMEVLKQIDNNFEESDLPEVVRAALLAFHKRHYRPKNMHVVVVGPQSLDTLESWVVPRFSKIPDLSDAIEENEKNTSEQDEKWNKIQQLAATLIDEAAAEAPPVAASAAKEVKFNPAFRPELQGGKWPIVVTTKPLQSVRKLVLLFPMPPTYENPDRSPTRILSHLFGHEGKGSPFAALQDAGWLSSLSSGSRVSSPDQNLFQIDMSLTEEGEQNWKEVTKVIFAYASMLADSVALSLDPKIAKGSNDTCSANELARIWDEVAQIERMHFHQTSPGAVYR